MENKSLHSIFCKKKEPTPLKRRIDALVELMDADLKKPESQNNPKLMEIGKKLRETLL
jgi:hypothetical protein